MPNLKNKINVFARGAWQRMSHQGAGRPSFVSTKPKATVKRTPSACNQQPAGQPKRRSRLVARQPVSRCSTEIRVGSPHPSLDSVSSALNRLIATLDLQQPGMSSPPPGAPPPLRNVRLPNWRCSNVGSLISKLSRSLLRPFSRPKNSNEPYTACHTLWSFSSTKPSSTFSS